MITTAVNAAIQGGRPVVYQIVPPPPPPVIVVSVNLNINVQGQGEASNPSERNTSRDRVPLVPNQYLKSRGFEINHIEIPQQEFEFFLWLDQLKPFVGTWCWMISDCCMEMDIGKSIRSAP
ncbi:hypothetical protein Pfo_000587 [Paulownia fortunei]|nr:hypothetical protein Pfo_000587 [Paulownia fortunei]